MSNPNTVTVYSPQGEPFEMSKVNARDLTSHAGWTNFPPNGATAAPAVEEVVEETVEEVAEETAEVTETEDAEEAAEDETTEEDEEAAADESATEVAAFTTEEEFAHLTEREDVVAYLAVNFPDFRPHHKSSRDGLVLKAIELAGE